MTDEKWRIAVDRNACRGTGMCEALAPKHFKLLNGTSHTIEGEVDPDDDLIEAAESCPLEAIRVTAADGRPVAPEYTH